MSLEKNIYTASDFARYYSGKMPIAEMHALERAALNDSFLSDALEGYQHSISPVNEASEINKRLQERVAGKSKNNVKGLWLKIAAIFLVMAGLGYFIYKQNEKTSTKQYAQNEQPSAIDQRQDSPAPAFSPLPPTAESNKMLLEKGEKKAEQISRAGNAPKVYSQNNMSAMSSEGDIKMSADKNVANAEPANGKIFKIQGKVTDIEGKGLEGAIVSAPVVNADVTTDSNGRFYLQSGKKDVIANISSDGYNSKEKILNASKEQYVILQKDATATKIIADNARAMSRKKISSAPVFSNNAVPVGGLEKFAQYITQNKIPVYDVSGNVIEGKVILQYYLDAFGQPESITIKRSLCSKCDLQALQLLKNGVKWMGKEEVIYETEISF